jgi:phosphatidylinositol glycan class H protein
MASYVSLLLRVIAGISTALLLWLQSRVESVRTESILLRVLGHFRASQLLALVDMCEWMYLAPSALVMFVLVFRRNYTGIVLPSILPSAFSNMPKKSH